MACLSPPVDAMVNIHLLAVTTIAKDVDRYEREKKKFHSESGMSLHLPTRNKKNDLAQQA